MTAAEQRVVRPGQVLLSVHVVRLDPDLPLPGYAHVGDAGADLVARIEVLLEPNGGRAMVPTGIALAIPVGYAGFVQPRSGLALRHGVTCLNTPGLIDSGYRDELAVLLVNTDPEVPYRVHRGRPDRPAGHPAGGNGRIRRGGPRWPGPSGASAASGRRGGEGMARLTGLDGAFLALESPTTHLHIMGHHGLRPRRAARRTRLPPHPFAGRRARAPGAAVPDADGRDPLRPAAPDTGR